MPTDVQAGLFTVAVFQDVSWAARALDALLRRETFPSEWLSIIGKDSPELAALIEHSLGQAPDRLEIAHLGAALVHGPIVGALQGSDRGLAHKGIAATMRRVGFQPHDGRIYETLAARGGVLVAVHSEPRASDALAVMHSYGGGNAAIGAWGGRV
jgi:hypothetical protein